MNMSALTDIKARRTVRERQLSADILRLRDKLAIWAKRPSDDWARLEAWNAALFVFGEADDMYDQFKELLFELRLDDEGYPLNDEGDAVIGADRGYVPMGPAKVEVE